MLHALRSIGVIQWKRGRLDLALNSAEQSRVGGERLGHPLLQWYGALLKGMVLMHSGAFQQASAALEQRASTTSPSADARPSLLTTEFLGDIHLEQGRAEEALTLYDEVFPKAIALVPKGDIVAELRRRRAECYLLLHRAQEAYDEARLGLEHCRELGDRYEEAATYRVAAHAAAAVGRIKEAKQLFEQGFSYYEDIETPYEWGKLWMAYGDWLRGPHAGEYADPRGALEAYIVAREHFERMGAEAKLAEANGRFSELSVALSGGTPPPSGPPGRAAVREHEVVAGPVSRVVHRRLRRSLDRELERRSEWAFETFGLLTRYRPLLEILMQAEKVARSRAPVLVLGESGTGKELVARGIHRLSGRTGAYLAINCGALPRETMESELFGHLAGSFTGAHRDKPGLFEVCDKGTTFLDEIGEMSPDLQSKLLRFLETGESRRMGATKNSHADVRIVAATNRPRGAIERGEGFRTDLYYRLAHAVVELPPLRQRSDDLELLIEHFRLEACERERKQVEFGDEALERLLRHGWPGNVRQLRAVVGHAVLVTDDGHAVPPHVLQIEAQQTAGTFSDEMDLIEKRRMEDALRQHDGSKALAARALRMKRTTFYAKMKRYGMM